MQIRLEDTVLLNIQICDLLVHGVSCCLKLVVAKFLSLRKKVLFESFHGKLPHNLNYTSSQLQNNTNFLF